MVMDMRDHVGRWLVKLIQWDHQSGPIREVYLHSRGIVHRDLKPGALSWWGVVDFSCDSI